MTKIIIGLSVVDIILILANPKFTFYFNIPTSLCSRQKDLGRSIHTQSRRHSAYCSSLGTSEPLALPTQSAVLYWQDWPWLLVIACLLLIHAQSPVRLNARITFCRQFSGRSSDWWLKNRPSMQPVIPLTSCQCAPLLLKTTHAVMQFAICYKICMSMSFTLFKKKQLLPGFVI